MGSNERTITIHGRTIAMHGRTREVMVGQGKSWEDKGSHCRI